MDVWGWNGLVTIVPPLVAIGVALVTKRVVAALTLGLLCASVVVAQGDVAHAALAAGGFVWGAVSDYETNLIIVLFTCFVAAMVAVLSVSGATRQIVHVIEARARGPRGAMIASWIAGFVVFFDDYANCMIVGNAMGPVCDRNGVSRAKLAYIVDSTAAPVASLVIVSTWAGFEIGLIGDALANAGSTASGFEVFLMSVPYRFYSFFALAMVGFIAWSGRDFGPMAREEHVARRIRRAEASSEPVSAIDAIWAALPVFLLVGVTFGLLLQSGIAALDVPLAEARLYQILADADAYTAMLTGSIVAYASACLLALTRAGTSVGAIGSATVDGLKHIALALVVLYLAWSLGAAIEETGANLFVASLLGDWFPAALLPTLIFLVAAAIAFATGTSFGTMTILIPLAVPLAVDLGAGDAGLLYAVTSAVLAGACLGDHASPISDTTILSATGANVDLVTHVRTQLPYALTAGAVAIALGYLPAGFGVPPWISLPLGILAVGLIVGIVGREAEEAPVSPAVGA